MQMTPKLKLRINQIKLAAKVLEDCWDNLKSDFPEPPGQRWGFGNDGEIHLLDEEDFERPGVCGVDW